MLSTCIWRAQDVYPLERFCRSLIPSLLPVQIDFQMSNAQVVIVGGGLSGLYSAYLLERSGFHDYLLLEGRGRFGGRIESITTVADVHHGLSNPEHCFDLGATWYWPEMQPELDAVIRKFDIKAIPQFERGSTLVERSREGSVARTAGYPSFPTSVRLSGGMQSLTEAIRAQLPPERLVSNRRVTSIRNTGDLVTVTATRADGSQAENKTSCVLLALPPRLASSTISFHPELPPAVSHEWAITGTWMAPHAKYLAVYDKPFWRESALSGQVRSSVGPLGEIHDASTEDGDAALFGFFGVPAEVRHRHSYEVLMTHCRAQLQRLFGPMAGTPKLEVIRDWSAEEFTATTADHIASGEHAFSHSSVIRNGPWSERIIGVGSEWSSKFPGYVAGAIDAAESGVQALRQILERRNA